MQHGLFFQYKPRIRVQVRLSNLDIWAGVSGFTIEPPSGSDQFVVRYDRPDEIKIADLQDQVIYLDFFYSAPLPGWGPDVRTQATITQEAWLRVEFAEDQLWEQCWLAIRQLQQFVSLGVGEPVYPLKVQGQTDAYQIMLERDKYENHPVDIYYQQSSQPVRQKTVDAHDMVFMFGDMGERPSEIVANFISKEALLKPVYDLYFAMLFSSRSYLEPRFLGLMQALEVYHRRTMDNEELPKAEHKNRKRAILNAVPAQYKRWLEHKLQYSNELDLKTRLTRLLDQVADVVSDFIPDKDAFATKVSKTRNYLTHFNPALKSHAATGEELYYLTEKVRLLLEICLFMELGFDPELVKELTLRKRQGLIHHYRR